MKELICSTCETKWSVDQGLYNEMREDMRPVHCPDAHPNAVMTKDEEIAELKAANVDLSLTNTDLGINIGNLTELTILLQRDLIKLRSKNGTLAKEDWPNGPERLVVDIPKKAVFLDGIEIKNRDARSGCVEWGERSMAVLALFMENCGTYLSEKSFAPEYSTPWKLIKSFVEPLSELFAKTNGGLRKLNLPIEEVRVYREITVSKKM